jgi:protein-tyrosine-phosphatase
MSRALFERVAAGRHGASSAGTEPAETIHPEVVAAMAEMDIDVRDRKPQRLTDEMAAGADIVVTMGCGDACPVVPGKTYLDWDLPDPKDRPIEEVREIRDEIGRRIAGLVERLDSLP